MSSSPRAEGDPSPGADRAPRLDAEGLIVRGAPAAEDAPPLPGPSRSLPLLVTGLGVLLVALALTDLLASPPSTGGARPMVPLVLASALALGGFSAVRMVQLLRLARSRVRALGRGEKSRAVPWGLTQDHALHGMWVVGVGASIALMGLLGVWSLLDGQPSGLEPGWPLLLGGAAVSLLGHRLRERIEALWEESGDGL